MKKAQVGLDTVVALAILALVLVVLFIIVFPSFKDVLIGEGEQGACEWSLVLHSLTKLGDWSLIPAECRANRIEIDMKYLERFTTEARRRIGEYDKDTTGKYDLILKDFNDVNNKKQVYEWALNRAVAQEMRNCWSKVFKGKLPLFDQWWNLYDFPWETPIPGEGEGHVALRSFFGKFYGPPTNCIICSRIKFSQDVQDYFAGKEITSLDNWLRYNYPRYGGTGYYEELAEGQSELNSLFTPPYSFGTSKPLAVLYEKIYYYQGMFKWTDKLIKYATGGKDGTYELNYLKLVPYTQEKLISPPDYGDYGNKGGEGCTFVLD